MSKKVLVIGSINKDLVVNTNRFPKEGETILGNSFSTYNGGKGANQAAAIAKLNACVSIFGAVGDDSFGVEIKKSLSDINVNTDNIIVKKDSSTGIAIITVDSKGANHIVVVSGANFLISKEDIKKEIINDYDIIVLQLEIPLDIVEYIINISRELNKTVVLNPSPAIKLSKEILSGVDILIPNETEIELIGGFDYVLSCGVKNIILTLGENGCDLIDTSKNIKHFDAYKVNVVDTTAAGDSFLGAIVRMISYNNSLEEAILFAMKVASITVQRKGAIDSIPTYDEVISYK